LDAAAESVKATRKKVNDDEANGIAQLEREGMTVVKQVNGASFRDALKAPYANYAKEFGAERMNAIQAVK
jgi:TRAP-type C4-dicarboxylate transport system substrate-binding protein